MLLPLTSPRPPLSPTCLSLISGNKGQRAVIAFGPLCLIVSLLISNG